MFVSTVKMISNWRRYSKNTTDDYTIEEIINMCVKHVEGDSSSKENTHVTVSVILMWNHLHVEYVKLLVLQQSEDWMLICPNVGQMWDISHTDVKPFACGVCQTASFATIGRLNAHLSKCGKPLAFQCTECGKHFSSQQVVDVHIGSAHTKDGERQTWACHYVKIWCICHRVVGTNTWENNMASQGMERNWKKQLLRKLQKNNKMARVTSEQKKFLI